MKMPSFMPYLVLFPGFLPIALIKNIFYEKNQNKTNIAHITSTKPEMSDSEKLK